MGDRLAATDQPSEPGLPEALADAGIASATTQAGSATGAATAGVGTGTGTGRAIALGMGTDPFEAGDDLADANDLAAYSSDAGDPTGDPPGLESAAPDTVLVIGAGRPRPGPAHSPLLYKL